MEIQERSVKRMENKWRQSKTGAGRGTVKPKTLVKSCTDDGSTKEVQVQ
jgi:hypothetical protein